MAFYGATILCEIPIHRDIHPMYFGPMGGLYPWLRFYIWSNFRTAAAAAIMCENLIILDNIILCTLPGTPGF